MTSKDVLLLLLGGIVGAVFNSMYGSIVSAVLKILRRTRAALRRWTGAEDNENVRYYASRNLLENLYKPQAIACEHQPLLHNPNLTFNGKVDRSSDAFISFTDGPRDILPVNRLAIWRARFGGVRLFDGEILYVKRAEVASDGGLRITTGRCNYLSYASQKLELRPRRGLKLRRSITRDRYLSRLDESSIGGPKPQVIGCVCVTLIQEGLDYYVAIATRSHQVLTSPGAKCVMPTFGLESNIRGGIKSQYGLLFHNYLREFAEEFFGIDDLANAALARRAHPDWIEKFSPVSRVTEEANAGRLKLEILDFAVGVEDAALDLVMLAEFESPEFARWLRREMTANWETSEGEADTPPIQFVRLNGPEIDDWARQGKLAASAVFALDAARLRYGRNIESAESMV